MQEFKAWIWILPLLGSGKGKHHRNQVFAFLCLPLLVVSYIPVLGMTRELGNLDNSKARIHQPLNLNKPSSCLCSVHTVDVTSHLYQSFEDMSKS
jgi:hypothetical protein